MIYISPGRPGQSCQYREDTGGDRGLKWWLREPQLQKYFNMSTTHTVTGPTDGLSVKWGWSQREWIFACPMSCPRQHFLEETQIICVPFRDPRSCSLHSTIFEPSSYRHPPMRSPFLKGLPLWGLCNLVEMTSLASFLFSKGTSQRVIWTFGQPNKMLTSLSFLGNDIGSTFSKNDHHQTLDTQVVHISPHTHTRTRTSLKKATCILCLVAQHVWFFANPWTIAHQPPVSVEFSGKNTGVVAISFPRGSFQPRDWIHVQVLKLQWAEGI